MKKHPIDDLFSRKLRDAEISPREDAYLKLQERMQAKQRRIGGWWQQRPWLAAAGICLLLGAGWIVWTNNNSQTATIAKNQVVPQKPLDIPQNTEQMALSTKKEHARKKALPLPATIESKVVQATQQTKALPLQEIEANKNTEIQVAQTVEPPIIKKDLPIINREVSSAIAQTSPSIADNKQPEKTIVLQLPELKETLVALNDDEIRNNSPKSSNAESTEDILSKPQKSSRMAKVWKQLKNAKNGERVDWEEVGINPKLLAKATGKNQ